MQHSGVEAWPDMGKLFDGVAEVALDQFISLELENYDEDMKQRVLYALYYGPCGIKTNDFSCVENHKDENAEEVMSVDPTEVQCPENVVRKEEKLMDLDYVINAIQNKFYF